MEDNIPAFELVIMIIALPICAIILIPLLIIQKLYKAIAGIRWR